LLDPVDLIETCIVLRDTVSNLTSVVGNLTDEIRSLS